MPVRLRVILSVILGFVVIAFVYCWYRAGHPHVGFPEERLELVKGSPVFSPDDISPDGLYAIAFAVRGATFRPVERVITDYRFDEFGVSYAFIGKRSGTVFTRGDGGIDAATIEAKASWEGDPHTFVLEQPRRPSPGSASGVPRRDHEPAQIGAPEASSPLR